MKKSYSYAYPSSPTAERLGRGKTGTFYTHCGTEYKAHDTALEAVLYCEAQPGEYPNWLQHTPDVVPSLRAANLEYTK